PEQSMDPRPERMDADAGAALVDSAIYVEGRRVRSPKTLADTYRMFQDEPPSMAWTGLYRPSEEQLLSLARQFSLHESAVEDAIVAGFEKHGIDEELRSYLRDVTDHATTVAERVDSFRQMLQDILTVNATLVTQAQNEEMKAQNEEVKKISAWAAILFAPTLIGTIYGMNFRRMPELHWYYGYPFALALMAAVCATLYLAFKRRGWL